MLTFEKKGYIAIVVAIFVPIVLYGVKFMLDNMSAHRATMEKTASEDVKKHCAKDAALQVAKNWNPGLTLGQQKAAVLKVADAVYNASPCYFTNSVIGRAIYGLDVKKGHKAMNRHPYMPTNVSFTRTKPTLKTISYSDPNPTKYTYKWHSHCYYWNTLYALWRTVDKGTDPQNRVSDFDEVTGSGANYTLNHHDIYIQPKQRHTGDWECSGTYPNNTKYTGSTSCCSEDLLMTIPSKVNNVNFGYHPSRIFTGNYYTHGIYSSSSSTYKVRSEPNDQTVQVSVKDDKIKVLTDDDVGYAKPAECNVDIVLAVPVNGAACNINNLDAVSAPAVSENDTAEPNKSPFTEGCTYPVSGAVDTPIYQIGQACKGFVKQFYHTRGVNMGLIPYSAKVSISPDHAKEWTVAVPKFDDTSTNIQVICGAALYGTSGEKDANLTQAAKKTALSTNETLPTDDTPYFWGGVLTGCPIMCRRGSRSQVSRYGNNYVCNGKLLDMTNPSSSSSYKFIRMNLNPCNVGYANMLTMKCEKKSRHFLPNPFYMIEPTADLVKIYEMCNALYPYYDLYSVSNFIFIPLEWANNFFQDWTKDPKCDASADNALEENQQLSRQSKMTSGRKKAVILIVNKPDWFEPSEMTYLGFNNDASEVPTVLSDKIDFSIDYSDTSKKFLDDTNYDGTIQGPNKILKYTQQSGTITRDSDCYICPNSGAGRLSFSHRGLIKLVVDKYKPACGSCENTGVHSITGSTTFTFSGGSVPSAGSSWCVVNSTGGKNFGHNLSIYKVRYKLDNAKITACTLTGQILRDYGGMYGYKNSATRLILNDGTEASRSNSLRAYFPSSTSSATDTWKYLDSCVLRSSYWSWGSGGGSGGGYRYGCCSISHPIQFTIWGCSSYTVWNSCDIGSVRHLYYHPDNNHCTISSNGWRSFGSIPGGTYSYLQYYQYNGTGCYHGQFYFVNSGTKTLDVATGEGMISENRAVCLRKDIYGHDWICFQGDGTLQVTVDRKDSSKPASIRFYDDNREDTAANANISHKSYIRFTDVSGDSSEHVIKGETELWIEPQNISGTAVNFTLQNIHLISAEITNRPYEKITPTLIRNENTITLNCKRPFKITATGTSETVGSLERYVSFDKPDDGTTRYKEFFYYGDTSNPKTNTANNGAGFYLNPGNTKYFHWEHGSFYEKWDRRAFIIPDTSVTYWCDDSRQGPPFGEDKLKYTLINAKINTDKNNTFMSGQELRVHYQRPTHNPTSDDAPFDQARMDAGITFGKEGKITFGIYKIDKYGKFWGTSNNVSGVKFKDKLWWKFPIHNATLYIGHRYYMDSVQHFFHTGTSQPAGPDESSPNYQTSYWFSLSAGMYRCGIMKDGSQTHFTKYTDYDCKLGDNRVAYLKMRDETNTQKPWILETTIGNFTNDSNSAHYGTLWLVLDTYNNVGGLTMSYIVCYNKDKVWADSSGAGYNPENCIKFENGVIKFKGVGDLRTSVTADPITWNKFTQAVIINGGTWIRVPYGGTREVIVDPYNYTYTRNGDNYTVKVEWKSLTSTPTFALIDTSPVFEFTNPTLPQLSSVVDFSDPSKIKYDSSLLVFGNFSKGPLEKTEWDDKVGYWKINKGYDFWDTRPYSKNDVFITTGSCDYPAKGYLTHYFYDDNGDGKYYPSGICKSFYIGAIKSGLGVLGYDYYFINAGFTKPINTVLYQYAVASSTSGVNVDSFGSHDNDFNTSNLRKLTTAACDKLKGTSVGARVYVVKYRCQDKYLYRAKPDINSTATEDKSYSHSYKEIDVCASETTDSKGNTVKHLYSASSQDELTTCLNKIADDIKNNFAEYKAAKVVE